eukprot:2556478-Prymnesium_polylepis.1
MVYPRHVTIYEEGVVHDSLYLLYRGRVDLFTAHGKGVVSVYPGAFFNEKTLYAPAESPTLMRAVTAEDSLLLRVPSERLYEMQRGE